MREKQQLLPGRPVWPTMIGINWIRIFMSRYLSWRCLALHHHCNTVQGRNHMEQCSTHNLPAGPERCMSTEYRQTVEVYWENFKKSLFYQWKQRQGIVWLWANLCGGRLGEWWSEQSGALQSSEIIVLLRHLSYAINNQLKALLGRL